MLLGDPEWLLRLLVTAVTPHTHSCRNVMRSRAPTDTQVQRCSNSLHKMQSRYTDPTCICVCVCVAEDWTQSLYIELHPQLF